MFAWFCLLYTYYIYVYIYSQQIFLMQIKLENENFRKLISDKIDLKIIFSKIDILM